MTSLEQLSLAEFSGDEARPKVYENSFDGLRLEGQNLGLFLVMKYII